MASSQHAERGASSPPKMLPAAVLSNRRICRDHYRLRLRLSGFPASEPGQFVNLLCAPGRTPLAAAAEWRDDRMPRLRHPETVARTALLRRPFSLAGRSAAADGSVELDIIQRVVGVGTGWLARLEAGSPVSVLGPLGNGFVISRQKPLAALVGGGCGIGPMLYLAEALGLAGKKSTAFVGVRTADALPLTVDPSLQPSADGEPTMCVAEFAEYDAPTVVATDDGSLGFAGTVDRAVGGWIDRLRAGAEDLAVFACGPEPMLKAVAGICISRRIECQVAMERKMACGVGACQGCPVKVRTDAPPGWRFALTCKDGPVFDADEVIWE